MIVAVLLVAEFGVLLGGLAVYRKGERSIGAFLAGPAGWACAGAFLIVATMCVVIAYHVRTHSAPRARWFSVAVLSSFCSVGMAVAGGEVVARLAASNDADGPVLASTRLLPRSWESVAARNLAVLARASGEGSYLVSDAELGWTVGPSRRSRDYNRQLVEQYLARVGKEGRAGYPGGVARSGASSGEGIYLSSAEGIRSPQAGMSFETMPVRRRIALVGDSFTFGLEVVYEETWGHQLEMALGPDFQILNFGVDGYGVDQAYMRYQRDVVPWLPEVVILGVISHDLRRTMCIYGFLCFPGFEMPFAKPRFVLKGHELALLNVPLPRAASLFGKRSIAELPFIEDDISFRKEEWDGHAYDRSYVVRFLRSRFSPWMTTRPTVTEEALRAVNGEIFRTFFRMVRANGSTPLVVVFPSRADFISEGGRRAGVAREVLEASGIPYRDMTECVREVSPGERFEALHYSARTNLAVARCLEDSVRAALRK